MALLTVAVSRYFDRPGQLQPGLADSVFRLIERVGPTGSYRRKGQYRLAARASRRLYEGTAAAPGLKDAVASKMSLNPNWFDVEMPHSELAIGDCGKVGISRRLSLELSANGKGRVLYEKSAGLGFPETYESAILDTTRVATAMGTMPVTFTSEYKGYRVTERSQAQLPGNKEPKEEPKESSAVFQKAVRLFLGNLIFEAERMGTCTMESRDDRYAFTFPDKSSIKVDGVVKSGFIVTATEPSLTTRTTWEWVLSLNKLYREELESLQQRQCETDT